MNAGETAGALARARLEGRKLAMYPGQPPEDAEAAFRVQLDVTRALGWRQAGWKIGCTSKAALKALGASQPFPGPLFHERLYGNGAHVPTREQAMRIVEPEIAFTLGFDLLPGSSGFGRDEVLDAVASVHPALEFIDRRAPGGLLDGLTWCIADGGISDALVLGPGRPICDIVDLAAVAVTAAVNGKVVCDGTSANAWGGPDHALTWLANYLSGHRIALKAGDVVTTGLLTDIFTIALTDEVEATFDGLGRVEARA